MSTLLRQLYDEKESVEREIRNLIRRRADLAVKIWQELRKIHKRNDNDV